MKQISAYEPYPEDQALAGPDMPPMATILDVIRYCTTVHSRFGNTVVEDVSLKWGASALNARDDIKQLRSDLAERDKVARDRLKRIEQLDKQVESLQNKWASRDLRIEQLEAVLQSIVNKTPANEHKKWPHHHWYLVTAQKGLDGSASGRTNATRLKNKILRETLFAMTTAVTDWQSLVEELIEYAPPSDEHMDEFRRLAHQAAPVADGLTRENMQLDADWLRNKIKNDPDDESCEAGARDGEGRKIWGELYIDAEGKANLDCHIHSSVKFGEAEAALIKFVELLQGQIDRKGECPLHIQEKS